MMDTPSIKPLFELDAVVSVAMPNCNNRMRDSPLDADLESSESGTMWNHGDEPHDGHRDMNVDAEQDDSYLKQLERRWRAALVAAAYYTKADCLIIPDAGCGVFNNPPELV